MLFVPEMNTGRRYESAYLTGGRAGGRGVARVGGGGLSWQSVDRTQDPMARGSNPVRNTRIICESKRGRRRRKWGRRKRRKKKNQNNKN